MKTFAQKTKKSTHPVRRTHAAVLPFFNPAAQAQRAQVRQVLRAPQIQAKLTIGQPNDKYEQEADRVADEVMRMPEPVVQRQSDEEEEKEEKLQAKPIGERITPLVQRQAEPEENEEEQIQAKAEGAPPKITPNLESHINALHGGGQPLSKETRNFFESRFGQNFSGVRVHNDSNAHHLARSINAKAFTRGNDVVFGGGEYSPESSSGKRLLGHELTHVVQQNKIINPVLQKKEIDLFTEKITEDLPYAYAQLIQKINVLHQEILRQRSLPFQSHSNFEIRYNLDILKTNYSKLRKQLLKYESQKPLTIVLVDNWHTSFQGGVRNRAITSLHKAHNNNPTVEQIRNRIISIRLAQRRYFVNVARHVKNINDGHMFEVADRNAAQDTLRGIVRHLPKGTKITTLALVGHGTPHGWQNIGDVGKKLLDRRVKQGLSPNLKVILYMCSAGRDPGPIHQHDQGYMRGGLNSYAANLRGRLVQGGIFNANVWAHVTRGKATKNPQWRIFETEEIQDRRRLKPETSYFRRIFDDRLVTRNFRELQSAQHRYNQTASHNLFIPQNPNELRVKWMWYFYYNITQQNRGEIAEQIPFKPNKYHDVILKNWNKYFYLGDLNVIKPVPKGHYAFLNKNNFKILRINLFFLRG